MPTIHASAVLVGARAVLILGPSGSGKSSLALALIQAGATGALPFARLVGDDRIELEATSGRLLIRPTPALAGLIEVRGLGIRQLPYEAVAVVERAVELGAGDVTRLPDADGQTINLNGVRLPRLAVAAGQAALPPVLAWLRTTANPS